MSYKSIKYEQESDTSYRFVSTSYTYIFFCFLLPIILLISILVVAVIVKNKLPQYGMPLIIIFGIILCSVPVLLHIRHRRISRKEDDFGKMRKRFLANGTLYYGVITEIKEIRSTEAIIVGRRPREVVVTRYSYTASYTNGNNEETEIESYIMLKADKDAVGRKCRIYECEGKTLIDAIEQEKH